MLLFLVLGLMLDNSFVGGILVPGSRPFAIALVCGALLLLRFWKALLLFEVGVIGIAVDMWLAGQYTSDVQNALAYSSATGMLSGATSVAMLIITLVWVGVLFWWSRTGNPRFRLQHRDLHAFAFFGLAAAVFEVTDASLFALLVLYLAWLVFSLFLDKARYSEPPKPSENNETKSSMQTPPNPSTPDGEKQTETEAGAQAPTQNSSPGNSKQAEAKSSEGKSNAQTSPDNGGEPSTLLERIDKKLCRVRSPIFVLAILIVATVLAGDPLLRTQLASFTRSAPLEHAWFMWVLDPLARLATTLVPCLAMVLLVVLLDATIERLRGETSGTQDTFLKVLVSVPLFLIFLLGIGGLDLFTGAFGLKLSDRIVYYVTVPLLTSIWLDLKVEKLEDLFTNLKTYLKEAKGQIKLITTLLSILVPWLASGPATELADTVTKMLDKLQF